MERCYEYLICCPSDPAGYARVDPEDELAPSSPSFRRTKAFSEHDQPLEECMHIERTLEALLRERPYLKSQDHSLVYFADECRRMLNISLDEAQNALDALTMELDGEDKMIAAAFSKFDTDRSGILHGKEINFMLDYLGFPDSDADVKKLLSVVDTDGDKSVSFDEFLNYVGKLGGSSKLFELRRRQIKERGEFTNSVHDKDELRMLLQECGITPEAQAHWRLTASESELDSAAQLDSCQQEAIRHIRHLAQENHERALPSLQKRVTKLGYSDIDLWMCLSWIRELAPIIVHLNLDKVGPFLLKDNHYRNQFEVGTSAGLLNTAAREKWERGLFGTAYDKAKGSQRPKYGVQNIWNDPQGVQGAKQYGDSYMVLKDVRLRCTLSPQDSANLPAKRLAVLDFYAHVLAEYSDKELKETIRVAQKGDEKVGDSHAVIEKWGMYKEAQLHGDISLDNHVDALVVSMRHKPRAHWIEEICQKHKWRLIWMDDMRKTLLTRQSGVEADSEQWKAKLEKLGRAGTKQLNSITPGLCNFGCGRSAAPGKHFCCRGCEKGFGHDSSCQGNIKKMTAEGMCSVGCGKKAAKGSDVCCHRCKIGTGFHDRHCGLDPELLAHIAAGNCKMGCGRKVAPGKTRAGNTFDTCCRDCARGTGHAPTCQC